jgi:hypothetical protein
MVHPDSHRVSRAPWYSGTEREGTSPFAYGAVTLFGGTFQWPSTRRVLDNFLACAVLRPTTPREPKPSRFGLFRVRSPLLTESLICFLFLRVLRWFTSPGLPLPAYEFGRGSPEMTPEGLPHSEIPGSKPVCGSPGLIAACHVLHRFSAPRHPPSTLSSLTMKYLRRESFLSLLPDSLVKDRDHRGSKSPSPSQGAVSSALPESSKWWS